MNMKPAPRVTVTVSGDECQKSLLRGVKTLHDAVASTMGASGRTVIVEDVYGAPKPTKDGVTVAESIVPMDSGERMGAEILKQAARRTAEEAGDGTTASIVIANAILQEGIKHLKDKSVNTTDFIRGMNMAVDAIIEILDNNSIPVTVDSVEAVAVISTNGDTELAKKIADAYKEVGPDGVVFMQKSPTTSTYVTTTRGYELEKGFSNEVFALGGHKVEYKDPAILLSTVKIEHVSQIEPMLQYVMTNNHPLVIVAEVEDTLSAMLAHNVVNTKKLKCVIVSPSHFGVRRTDIMRDLASYTGATLVDEDTGSNFQNFDHTCMGACEKVVITKDKTVFLGGDDSPELINHLKRELGETDNKMEKEFLKERIAKLSSSVSFIYVGAQSEAEQTERADRVEDAIYAVRAALEEGIVAGGGVALLNAMVDLRYKKIPAPQGNETHGYNTVLNGCKAPITRILKNADMTFSEKDPMYLARNLGFNVRTGEDGNMIEMDIIDPVKVVKASLRNGVSAATQLLTTTSMVLNMRSV